MTPKLKLAADKPLAPAARSPERQALAAAHVARDEAERNVEEARRIAARGRDLVDKATHRLEAARSGWCWRPPGPRRSTGAPHSRSAVRVPIAAMAASAARSRPPIGSAASCRPMTAPGAAEASL
jgi:hypothetical protein